MARPAARGRRARDRVVASVLAGPRPDRDAGRLRTRRHGRLLVRVDRRRDRGARASRRAGQVPHALRDGRSRTGAAGDARDTRTRTVSTRSSASRPCSIRSRGWSARIRSRPRSRDRVGAPVSPAAANVGVGIPHTRSSHRARAISAIKNWYICASSEDGNSGRQSSQRYDCAESVPPIYANVPGSRRHLTVAPGRYPRRVSEIREDVPAEEVAERARRSAHAHRRVRRHAPAAPRVARGRARRAARARRDPAVGAGNRRDRRGARPVPAVLRARPRPGEALASVAAPRGQVPGVHRAGGRSPPHPPHARGRGGAGRHRHRRATGLCVPLTEAIALAHDCGHGPAGHASEEAFSPYLPGGYDHAVYGADVTLAELNLCAETLDGSATTRGAGPRRRRPRARSSPGPIASRTSATTSRTRCGPVSSRPHDLPEEVAEVVGRIVRRRSARSWARCSTRSRRPVRSG